MTEKFPITITQKALEQFQKIILQRDPPAKGVRLRIKSQGCAGFAYSLEFIDEIKEKDEKFVFSPEVTLFVHPASLMFLDGTEIDYADDPLKAGFIFKNPNEKGRCGCGASFRI